jgi:hypothetical protein
MVIPQAIHAAVRNDRIPDLSPIYQQSLPSQIILLPSERQYLECRNATMYDSLATVSNGSLDAKGSHHREQR